MQSLTFAEQVKIILKRRHMTIKRLAEMIEEETGKKMSRQNLTQKLNRDNFQEKDMRQISNILGCTLQLNILDESFSGEKEEMQVVAKDQASERDITMGEFVDMMNEADGEKLEEQKSSEAKETSESVIKTVIKDEEETAQEETVEFTEETVVEEIEERTSVKPAFTYVKQTKVERPEEPSYGMPEAQEDPEAENLELGEMNPYTGHEYKSNSVRIHPKRIGYVQVYDRSEHKWADMTEWAFLGYQERKKSLLGDEYEPPIYLD
ncbi:hypothetical protein LJC18_01585 [Lachnospiraceae bacterium OttesenSCG-928-E19]|nr:hypothetical protein [Lachnospiraceae bacterium OttesenSCG-928-E19]